MNRYKASKNQIVAFMTMTVYFAAGICFIIFLFIKFVILGGQRLDYVGVVCLIIIASNCMICIIWSVWKLLDDPLLGEVSFDVNGATFYTKLHIYRYPYAECLDMGFISAPGGQFVYLSRVSINSEQKGYLFHRVTWRRGKRNMPLYRSEFVIFQFEAGLFAEFISYVPEPFHTKLIDDLGWEYESPYN